MATRIEKDSLGEREVPATAYYGVQTQRAVDNFHITGQMCEPELAHAMGFVKEACAYANKSLGYLEGTIADAIISASREMAEGKFDGEVIVDPIQGGAGTSFNMNCNEVIANRALEILGKPRGTGGIISANTHVNMAQSTNDAFPTAMHLAAIWKIDELVVEMKETVAMFEKKAAEFDDCVKMGRTHLQDAIPIRFSQELTAYNAVLKRGLKRIQTAQDGLRGINLGATAVGTGLNADVEYIKLACEHLAKISNTNVSAVDDMVDGTQNTDCYLEVSGALAILAVSLSKVMNDLRLLASGPRCGFAEVILPPRQPGSSIMPGKVNPVIAECMNQVCFQVIGNNTTCMWASGGGQFELNVMEPVLFYNLLMSLKVMKNGLKTFRVNLLEGLKVDKVRMQEYVDNSVGIITAINPVIGYEKASEIAKEAIASGTPVRKICLERGYLTEQELDKILAPMAMTTPGIHGKEFIPKV